MKQLTQGNIYKNFILFAIPLVLTGMLSQAYNLIDTMIAGRFLGQAGLAAIGATSQAIMLLSALFWGFGAGFGVYVAGLFGAKDFGRIRQEVGTVLPAMLLVLVVAGVMTVLACEPILTLLQVDPAVRADAAVYFCIYVGGLFAIVFNNTFSVILNGLGCSGFPLWMSLLSAALNIGGNLLSVAVFDWGVAGVAASSVLAALIVDLFYLLKLHRCYRVMGVLGAPFRPDWRSVGRVLRYGGPVAFQQMAMYVAGFAISPLVNGLGAAASAAYTVVMRIYDVNAGIYQNSAKTLSNYAAQCIGAGKTESLLRGLRVGLLQGVVFLLPALLLCSLGAPWVCGLFFSREADSSALEYAVRFAQVYLPFILFNVVNNLFHAFFRGIAAMGWLVAATLAGSVLRVVSGWILIPLWGMEGMYISWAFSWVGEVLLLVVVYVRLFSTADRLKRYINRLNRA